MSRNLSSVLHRELENLEKDPDSRRAAMKALKSHVKDLDSRTIPMFLARISETKEHFSSSGECVISLFEVLARSHGRNIVQHIDNIMSTIIKTLSSTAGSFALHQSCSKVVPAIARYSIDPLMPENEKKRVICSLCKPLSDALMGAQESAASGAALCLRALVESDNWRLASTDMVNEVCLKVAGALEEAHTQTNSHVGLVIALTKHNPLIVDAYARSLIRSGLQILSGSTKEKNSQKRLSAIQMINFLMKCVDSRSISSEIAKILDVMENCQNDHIPFVRGAALEALRTAKPLTGKKGSRFAVASSPIVGSNFDGDNDRMNQRAYADTADNQDSGSPIEIPSAESETVDSLADFENLVDSPLSIGKSSCSSERQRHVNRRLWNDDIGAVNMILKDGCCCEAGSGSNRSTLHFEGFVNNDQSERHKEESETLSSSVQSSARNVVMRSSMPSPQRSRPQVDVDDVKIHSTPQKLIRSLQNSAEANSGFLDRQRSRIILSPTSDEVEWSPTTTLNGADHSHILRHEYRGRNNGIIWLNKQQNIQEAEHVISNTDGNEWASSIDDVSAYDAWTSSSSARCEDKNGVPKTTTQGSRYGKAAFRLICCLLMIFLAVVLSAMWFDNEEAIFDVVPT